MAYLATQFRPSTSAPGDGSRTITILDSQPRPEDDESSNDPGEPSVGALRLRGGPRKTRQRVAWGEDVVDNEGCGKKSSKICCIYHKPKKFDESSDEDSSDSDTDSSCDHHHAGHHHSPRRRSDGAQPSRGGGDGAQTRGDQGEGVIHELEDVSEPNAYEIMPGLKKGKRKAA